MSERDFFFLVQDIEEAIENILSFAAGMDFSDFESDIKTRHAIQHNFMIIGEAVSRIPDEAKQKHPIINWRQLKDFRNVIVHEYFGIDNRIVWDIVNDDLPELKQQIQEIGAGRG